MQSFNRRTVIDISFILNIYNLLVGTKIIYENIRRKIWLYEIIRISLLRNIS